MNPHTAHLARRTVGKDRGVFDWNVSLIVEAIGHPAPQRVARKPAFIHGDVERMFVVIGPRPDRPQIFKKSFAVPKVGSHNKSLIHALALLAIVIEKPLEQTLSRA